MPFISTSFALVGGSCSTEQTLEWILRAEEKIIKPRQKRTTVNGRRNDIPIMTIVESSVNKRANFFDFFPRERTKLSMIPRQKMMKRTLIKEKMIPDPTVNQI